jgi:hypothetical protein
MIDMYLAAIDNVNYCPIKNEIQRFQIGDEILLDRKLGISRKGWLKRLIIFVVENGYNVDSGSGIPAFVKGLALRGHLSLSRGFNGK